jgi:hypothetical protein
MPLHQLGTLGDGLGQRHHRDTVGNVAEDVHGRGVYLPDPDRLARHSPEELLGAVEHVGVALARRLVGVEVEGLEIGELPARHATELGQLELSRQTNGALSARRQPLRLVEGGRHPIEPSICSSINLFISTAYSIGSSFVIGSMKPFTIIFEASSSGMPCAAR